MPGSHIGYVGVPIHIGYVGRPYTYRPAVEVGSHSSVGGIAYLGGWVRQILILERDIESYWE